MSCGLDRIRADRAGRSTICRHGGSRAGEHGEVRANEGIETFLASAIVAA